MLQRGQTTEERIAQIAQGFGQGAQNFIQGQDKQRSQGLQQEATRRQQAIQEMEIEGKLSEQTGKNLVGTGVGKQYLTSGMAGIGELMNAAPASRKAELETSKATLDAQYKQSQIDKNNKYDPTSVAGARAAAAEVAYGKRKEKELEETVNKAKIADFDISSPDIIPSQKDAEEVKKYNASNKNYQQIGNRLAGRLSALKTMDRAGVTNAYKLIEQDLTQMALQAKELANLGVLNGPDLELVNKDLGSINLSSINTLGTDAAVGRLKAALETAQNKLGNLASARGYKSRSGGIDKNSIEYKQNRMAELLAKQAGG
jgi:hypothetical protein